MSSTTSSKKLHIYMITAPDDLLSSEHQMIKTFFVVASSATKAKKYHPAGKKFKSITIDKKTIWGQKKENGNVAKLPKAKKLSWIDIESVSKLKAKQIKYSSDIKEAIMSEKLSKQVKDGKANIKFNKHDNDDLFSGKIIATIIQKL